MQTCQSRPVSDGADGLLGTGGLWTDRHELLTVVSEFLSVQLIPLYNGHGKWLAVPIGWGGLARYYPNVASTFHGFNHS